MNESQVEEMSYFERNDDSNVDGAKRMSVLAMAKQYEELHCQGRRSDRLPFYRRTTDSYGDRHQRRRTSAENKSKGLYTSSAHSQTVSGGEAHDFSEMAASIDHGRTSETPSPENATVCRPRDQTWDPQLPEKAMEAPSTRNSLPRSPEEVTEAPSYSTSEPPCTEPALEAPSVQTYDPRLSEDALDAPSSNSKISLPRSPEVTEAPAYSTSEPLWTEPATEAPSEQTSQLPEQVTEAPSYQTLEPQFPEDSMEAPTDQMSDPLYCEKATKKLFEETVRAPSEQTLPVMDMDSLPEETDASLEQNLEHMFSETATDKTGAGELKINQGDLTPVQRSLTKRFHLWLAKKLSRRSQRTSKRDLITSEPYKKTKKSSSHSRPPLPTTVSQAAIHEGHSASLYVNRMSGIEEGDVSQIPLPSGTPPASSIRRMSGIEEGVWSCEGDVSQIPLPPGTPPESSLRRITGIEDLVRAYDAGVTRVMPLPQQQVFLPRRAISDFIAQRASELLRNGWMPGTPLDRKIKLTRPTPSWLGNEPLLPPPDNNQ
jgi:hypothetical protein